MEYGPLPANNISQKLFDSQLAQCNKPYGSPPSWQPSPCCSKSLKLGEWYQSAPVNLWNTVGNDEGGPGFDSCNQQAYIKQAMLSQHYNYLSGNNTLPSNKVLKHFY